MPTRRPIPPPLLAFAALVLASCSNTRLVTQWQDPSVTQLRFTKVLSLCIAKGQDVRRETEDLLCAQMPRVACKPAYLAIPESMITDPEEANALAQQESFDGAVVIRLLDAREQVTYVPPSYGPTFWGYYGYAWPMAYDPGSFRTDQIVRIETSIYSVKEDRLLWVGTTETMNPDSLPDLVKDVAKAVRGELVKRQLIPASSARRSVLAPSVAGAEGLVGGDLRPIHRVDPDARRPGAEHAETAGRGARDVDDPAVCVRSAIGDGDDHRGSALEVGHAYARPER